VENIAPKTLKIGTYPEKLKIIYIFNSTVEYILLCGKDIE
jgi:hypothetical protein